MLAQKTVCDFLDELGSDSPAPGGGSVAALSGALGAQLTAMVCRLTVGNEKYIAVRDEIVKIEQEANTLAAQLTRFIDEDTQAFNKVMEAYKLPKETDEEKMFRVGAIQEAMKGAALLPLQVAEASLTVLRISRVALLSGNTNAASDAAVSSLMAYAGLQGAIFNVKINLAAIKDQAFVENTKEKVCTIRKSAAELFQEVTSIAERVIG